MKCPYCGSSMKDAEGAISTIITSYCQGGLFRRHDRINLSRLDNKFRTLSADIAKELEAKGYSITFSPEEGYYEINQMRQKVSDPSRNAQTKFDAGWALWTSGDRKEAMQIWEDNVREFPTHRDSWYNLGLAYCRDDQLGRGIECLKKAIEIDPSDGQAWWYLGYSYGLMGDQDQSKQAYKQAKALGWQQPPL